MEITFSGVISAVKTGFVAKSVFEKIANPDEVMRPLMKAFETTFENVLDIKAEDLKYFDEQADELIKGGKVFVYDQILKYFENPETFAENMENIPHIPDDLKGYTTEQRKELYEKVKEEFESQIPQEGNIAVALKYLIGIDKHLREQKIILNEHTEYFEKIIEILQQFDLTEFSKTILDNINNKIQNIINKIDKNTSENNEMLKQIIENQIINHTSQKHLTNAPKQDTFIVGREGDLKAVKQKLESDNTLLLMNGLGGIGKTTLARKYIIEFEKDYDHIVWLEVSKGVKEAFAGSTLLVKNLSLKAKNLKPAETFDLIMNVLKNLDGKNLMILDDAKEDFALVKKELPGKPNWKVLITSRQNFTGINSHYLNFLIKDAAFELFYKYYEIEKNDGILDKILKPVNYHTLVVELFSNMAEINGLTLQELHKRADAKGIDISNDTEINIEHSEKIITDILKYLNTTFPITELPSEKIDNLRKLAIMPSDFYSKTVVEFFLQIKEDDKDNFNLNLNKLSQMGWIERNKDQYKLHDIIRQLVLKDFPPVFEFYKGYIELITAICRIDQSKDNPLDKIQLMPFGLEILNQIKTENEAISRLNEDIASLYNILGEYQISVTYFLKALDIAERIGNKDLQDMINNNLALVYKALGQYEKARDLLEAALKSDLENFGEKHPTVATDYNNLGQLFLQTKDYELAMDNLQKALVIAKAVWGNDHPNIQTTLQTIYHILRILTHGVISDKDTKAIERLDKVKAVLSGKEIEMNNYLDFLKAVHTNENADAEFNKLTPEYQKVFGEAQQEHFWVKIQKHSGIAIETHLKEENQLFVLQKHKDELPESTHPEILKYYDFLLEYAKGKEAEEMQHTIDKPLWDMFEKMRLDSQRMK